MSSYKELIAKREALEQQIKAARAAELSEAVSRVHGLVTEFGLTEKDIFGKATGASKTAVAAKYRDPATGVTWSGRGRAPKWIDGQDREKFAV
jgi:DNA-binding protein H-NS